MADAQQPAKGHGFVSTVTRRALAPIVSAAATAVTAYLMRKAAELWEEKLQPKLEEKGGGRTVARETLETAAEKAGPVSDHLGTLAEKLDAESGDADREQQRLRREQSRKQRRKALEQTGSS